MAAGNPELELKRLGKLLTRGLPKLLLVYGESEFFRQQAMELVMAALPADGDVRSLDAVELRAGGGGGGDDDSDDDDAGDDAERGSADAGIAACPELQDLRGGGLFAKSAVLVVRRGKNWWNRHVATLASQLDRFSAGSACVIEADKLDKRKKVAANLVKATTEAGAAFEFRNLYELPYNRDEGLAGGELVKWLHGRAQQLGVALSDDAACLLVSQVASNPGELLAELHRVRDQLGADPRRPPLQPADLRGKLSVGFESTPFEFAEAVLDRDKAKALRSLQAMFARGVRDKSGKAMDSGGLLPFTTNWLFRSLAALYEGRLLMAAGTPERDVPALVGVRQFAQRFAEQLRRNDVPNLERGLLALQACQRQSRTLGEDGQVLLERFLLQWFDGAPIPEPEDSEA